MKLAPPRWYWLLSRLLLIYLGLVAFIYGIQDKLIYLPFSQTKERAETIAHHWELKPWPGAIGSGKFQGWATESPPHPRGTVIISHGNGGFAQARLFYRDFLFPLGYRVIFQEYSGYGARPGQPQEDVLVQDLRALVHQVDQTWGGPIFLLGESLGGGVSAAAAADTSLPIHGLLLITPWDSLPNVAQARYWFLPARWLVRDQYDSVDNLQHFSHPVFIVMAGRDEVIPNPLTLHLYQSLKAPKKLVHLQEATHNTWLEFTHPDWWQEVMAFLSQNL